MRSPETLNNQALDTLLSVQETLVETNNLLDIRADRLVEDQATLTEIRALLNTVRGTKLLVELQLRANGLVK